MRVLAGPVHEILMLLAVGVPVHEWMGLALAAAVLVHLLRQWSWIASIGRTLRAAGRRQARIAWLLNLGLFLSFTVTGVSGVRISKVAVRGRALPPADFLKWQDIHGLAAQVLLVLVGLHLALNWDRLLCLLGVASGRGRDRSATVARPAATGRGVRAADVLPGALRVAGRASILAAAVGVVTLASVGLETSLPNEDVVIETRDGRITHAPPTADLTRLRDEERTPEPARGLVQLGARGAVVGLAALAGRKVLRLRIGG